MIKKIEVFYENKTKKVFDKNENISAISGIVKYIEDKVGSDWNEFRLTNKSKKRLIILENSIVTIGNNLQIGRLIDYLDKTERGWERFTINCKTFRTISCDMLKENMLYKDGRSLSNLYRFVTASGELVISSLEENNNEPWDLNIKKNLKYQYCVICESLENSDDFSKYIQCEPS